MNEEMGFVSEKKEEENQSPSIGRSKAASSKGGSWWWQNVKPFVNGGSATLLTGLQIVLVDSAIYYLLTFDNELAAKVIKHWHYRENLKRLHVHLPIGASLNSVSFGSFEILTRKALAANHGIPLGVHQEACCAVFSGTVQACVATPFVSALRHAQTKTVREAKKLTYGDVFRALCSISKNQGISALWKSGVFWSSAAFSAGMLAPYNRSYHYFKVSRGFGEIQTQMSAGAVSGFVSSACWIPVKNVQTCMQAMRPNADGKFPFTSSLDCALKLLKVGGLVELYRGFPQFLGRSLPITMVTWMTLEDIRDFEESAGL